MTQKKEINKSDALDTLWRRGILYWKLDSCQKKMYDKHHSSTYRKVVLNCSRRIGKSYTLIVLALEYAMKYPNSQIKYACPTALMAQNTVLPSMREIMKDCPEDIKPNYIKSEKTFHFKNGSIIQVVGTDEGNAERLRGTASHLSIIDEAGFMDDLPYLLNSILLPQALTTNGKLIISSTPPKSPAHPFMKLIIEAQKHDSYIKKTIYDAVEDIKNDAPHLKNRLNSEVIEDLKQSVGGELSIDWRREFLCEVSRDASSSVIPEFTDALEAKIVQEWEKPPRFDGYVSLDLGFVDLTGVLFAYMDFKSAKLIIEDELLINGYDMTTQSLADSIKLKEKTLWSDPKTGMEQPAYLRIADADLVVLNDLNRMHKLSFIPGRNDNPEGAINEVRLKLQSEQIIINPRCKNLIFQIKAGTWAKNRRTFTRSEEAGHFDLLAALMYLVRNVQWNKNPYPLLYDTPGFSTFYRNQPNLTETAKSIKDIFNIKKKNNK